MSNSELILAVDIGTGATKAVLFDASLKQVSLVRRHYPILVPSWGWSEQEPDVIYRAVTGAIREAQENCPKGNRIRAISLSSQLYSVLAVGIDGAPLTNSVPWSDTRSAAEVERLRKDVRADNISNRTGCPVDAVYPLVKIKWMKDHLELPKSARFISIKEYVLFRLTGQFLADWSIASATGLFDIHTRAWDPGALDLLGIGEQNLSTLVPPDLVLNNWSDDAKELCEIKGEMPLVIGGGDGPLASLGVGAVTSDVLAVNVGTSAAARAVIHQPGIDPEGRLWTYLITDGLWVTGGMVSSGGIVFEWFLENFYQAGESLHGVNQSDSLYTYADQLADQIPPGADGLVFTPYLSGVQCPDWSPSTRGSFHGLDLKHRRGHFTRAVLEGITRSIYRVAKAIEALLDRPFEEVCVTGGLTASSVWLQIAADMFGATVVVPETSEGSARGAAMLAMISLGWRTSLQDFTGLFEPKEKVEPRPTVHKFYEEQNQRFLKLLDLTRELR
jgi:gluconokinase